MSLGSTGCTLLIDENLYTFKNFEFNVLFAEVPLSPSEIGVQPILGPSQIGWRFSGDFSVVGSEREQYLLSFYIDPLPPDIWRIEDVMEVNSPVAPGIASVLTTFCAGANFVDGSACLPPGTPGTLFVFDDGIAPMRRNSVSFTPVNNIAIRNLITLEANGASADFEALNNTVYLLPEPGSWLLAAGGLAGLVALRKRRRT
jgi:MYXO-CTERM domain-containing protein